MASDEDLMKCMRRKFLHKCSNEIIQLVCPRHDSLERHILEARLEGKRRKGRPTRRWTEDVKKWLPMSPTEAGRESQKRDVFRRMVREATSTRTCQDE